MRTNNIDPMTGQPQRGGGSDIGSHDTGSVTTLTDDQKAAARLRVATGAKSPDDCALLLGMLGLLPGTDPEAAP